MKQLIEEQLSQFEKQKEVYMTDLRAYYHSQWNGTDEEKEVYRIEAEKSRNVLNEWYVASLKQFIDGLIEREEGTITGIGILDESNLSWTWDVAKKNTIGYLKKLKEQME